MNSILPNANPNATELDVILVSAILKDTRRQLADYKAPERLWTVGAVPRNPLGEVDRRAAATAMLDRDAGSARRVYGP